MYLKPVFEQLNHSQTFINHIENLKKHAQSSSDKEKKDTIIPFPIDAFPVAIQQIISETNRCLNFPIDFIGSSIFYACSLAIGNTHQVEQQKTWYESSVLYMAIVGRAGTNKSHPLKFALKPIEQRDNESFATYEKERKEYEQNAKLSKKEKENNSLDDLLPPILKNQLHKVE